MLRILHSKGNKAHTQEKASHRVERIYTDGIKLSKKGMIIQLKFDKKL